MVDFAAHTSRIINRIGRPVTLNPSGPSTRVVNAIFSTTPADAFGLVSGVVPKLRISADDSADVLRGDSVSIGDMYYTVADIEDDSTDSGDRVLRLEAA